MNNFITQNRKAIPTFLFFTFALSSIFYLLIINTGTLDSGFGKYVTALMWCPGLAAIITTAILKREFKILGWQIGKTNYQLWSYLIPLLYVLIAYIIIWTVGWGGFYNSDFVNRISTSFGWGHLPKWLVIPFYVLFIGIFGMVSKMASALGEEIGWRGFLVPELSKNMDFTKTSIITGLIWAIWHYPILLFADYNLGTPSWYGLSCFTVMIISISFIFTWFRLKSNSLWTGVVLHASHNLFIQSIFSPLTQDTGNTKYYIDEFGVVLPIVCIGFAIFFWTKREEVTNSNNLKKQEFAE